MNKNNLDEIIELVNKALLVTDAQVINTEVEAINKTSFITIGGVLDSIKILAMDNLGQFDPLLDNSDNPERHNIAGGMNSPSKMQKEAFKEDN